MVSSRPGLTSQDHWRGMRVDALVITRLVLPAGMKRYLSNLNTQPNSGEQGTASIQTKGADDNHGRRQLSGQLALAAL